MCEKMKCNKNEETSTSIFEKKNMFTSNVLCTQLFYIGLRKYNFFVLNSFTCECSFRKIPKIYEKREKLCVE